MYQTCFYAVQVECDGIGAGVILNINPSFYIMYLRISSCCAGTREQVTTVMYRATALLITTDGKGPVWLLLVTRNGELSKTEHMRLQRKSRGGQSLRIISFHSHPKVWTGPSCTTSVSCQ